MVTIKKKSAGGQSQNEEKALAFFGRISDSVKVYQKQFAIALSLVVAILVVMGISSFLQTRKEHKAAPQLAAAYELYRPASGTSDDQRALDAFLAVAKQFPDTKSGMMAVFYAGNCLTDMGKANEAVQQYQSLINNHSNEKMLVGLAYQRMGYVYLGLGKTDDAKKSFQQAEAQLGAGASTIELARLYEITGDMPGARDKYKAVLDKLAGTGMAAEAMSKMQIAQMPPASPAPTAATK
jgi:predicted negative regulator of RcsB-dependent stress response